MGLIIKFFFLLSMVQNDGKINVSRVKYLQYENKQS
jgi:hypothetical protein